MGAALFFTFSGDRIHYGEADESLEVFKKAQERAAAEVAKSDTDSDGLKDWEEALWGTNPEKSDTDDDGTEDGKEVDTNRNPAIPGPDDTLDLENVGSASPGSTEAGEEPTATEKLAGTFFTEYLTMRQTGEIETSFGRESIIESTLREIQNTAPSIRKFVEKDILVSPQQGTDAVATYVNIVGATINRHSIQNENEAVILLRALEEEDEEVLGQLIPIQSVYTNISRDLKQVVVPKEAISSHLKLLNAVTALEKSIGDMRLAFSDPVLMFHAVTRYPEEANDLFAAALSLGDLLRRNNIRYEPTDPGYQFQIVESGS